MIINIHERTCPTTFVLVDLTPSESVVNTLERVVGLVNDVMTQPMTLMQKVIERNLRETEYLSLICELCHNAVQSDNPYTISNPRESVRKFLPLVKTSVALVCAANGLATLGKSIGIPSVDGALLGKGKEFLDKLGEDSLDDFENLQKRVERARERSREKAPAAADDTSGDTSDSSSPSAPPQMAGYCVREFHRWLKQVDTTDTWGGLSRKVIDGGDVLYVCKCCMGETEKGEEATGEGEKEEEDREEEEEEAGEETERETF